MIFAVVPFTFAVVMKTNRRLLDKRLDPDSPETRRFLEQWGRLHAVRTALSLAAFTILIGAAV